MNFGLICSAGPGFGTVRRRVGLPGIGFKDPPLGKLSPRNRFIPPIVGLKFSETISL